jgi:hypothetical protein
VTHQFTAYVMGRGGIELRPKNIWAKTDQRFNDVATEWEQKHSELCLPMGSFHPVVDSNMMVVAHYGTVRGDQLIGPIIEHGPEGAIVETSPEGYAAAGIHLGPCYLQSHARRIWSVWFCAGARPARLEAARRFTHVLRRCCSAKWRGSSCSAH